MELNELEKVLEKKDKLNHIAISPGNVPLNTKIEKLPKILDFQIKENITILSFHLSSIQEYSKDDLILLKEFFKKLAVNEEINNHKVRITVIGKWYDIDQDLSEWIKRTFEETKEYDTFFLNIYFNYDAQQELVDAARVMALKTKLEKIDPDSIDKQKFKENVYSSFFIPPEILYIYGNLEIPNFLLWDIVNVKIAYPKKEFSEFEIADLS